MVSWFQSSTTLLPPAKAPRPATFQGILQDDSIPLDDNSNASLGDEVEWNVEGCANLGAELSGGKGMWVVDRMSEIGRSGQAAFGSRVYRAVAASPSSSVLNYLLHLTTRDLEAIIGELWD